MRQEKYQPARRLNLKHLKVTSGRHGIKQGETPYVGAKDDKIASKKLGEKPGRYIAGPKGKLPESKQVLIDMLEGFYNTPEKGYAPKHQRAYTVGRRIGHNYIKDIKAGKDKDATEKKAKTRRDMAKRGSGGRSASKGFAEVLGDAGLSNRSKKK